MGAERQMQITLELTDVLPSLRLRPEILILEFLEDATAVVAESEMRVIHVARRKRTRMWRPREKEQQEFLKRPQQRE